MIVKEVIDFLHTIAPSHYQEDYDNSGLLIGDDNATVTSVLISLDVTEAVLEEAIEKKSNLIISHHPIIFSGVKRIVNQNYVQRIIRKAIKNDLNLFAIHTNLDNVYHHGVNTSIAQKLGLHNIQILRPKMVDGKINPEIGAGIIAELPQSMEGRDFLSFLKENLNLSSIKYTNLLEKPIKKVAICGGSGRFLLQDAITHNADVFVSSDFKYHEFFDADNQIVIADIGHYESERHTIQLLHEILTEKFNNFAAHLTTINTNPVNYFI